MLFGILIDGSCCLESKIVGAYIGYLTHLPDNARPRKAEARWEVTRYNVEDEDEDEKKNDDEHAQRGQFGNLIHDFVPIHGDIYDNEVD